MLIADYYTILGQEHPEEHTYLFRFILRPEAEVYRGHFPGDPITPGVCTLQMIKECLQSVLERDEMRLVRIKQCRFSRLLRPSEKVLQLEIRLRDEAWFTAQITDEDQVCMKIKAQYN